MTSTIVFVVVALDPLLASRRLASVALDVVELEDGRVMHQAIDGGDRHPRVREDGVPAGERLVGRDEDALALVALGDQFEQNGRFGLVAMVFLRQRS